jgi:hypothetical protein
MNVSGGVIHTLEQLGTASTPTPQFGRLRATFSLRQKVLSEA